MEDFRCCQLTRPSPFRLMPILRHIWAVDQASNPVDSLQAAIDGLQTEITRHRARVAQQQDTKP